MSSTRTGGSGRPSTRSRSSSRGSACQVSGRGVAEPDQQRGARLRRAPGRHAARVVARVALVLVGGVVLLVDDHEPESRTGANTAERGPTAIRASPARSRRHSS